MEEADIRYAEVKKAQYEFNRDIVNGAVNPVSLFYNFNIHRIIFRHQSKLAILIENLVAGYSY